MPPRNKIRYEARTGIDLTVVGAAFSTPPHVARIWRDNGGRRQTQIVAVYQNKWAAFVVAWFLNRLVRFEIWL